MPARHATSLRGSMDCAAGLGNSPGRAPAERTRPCRVVFFAMSRIIPAIIAIVAAALLAAQP